MVLGLCEKNPYFVKMHIKLAKCQDIYNFILNIKLFQKTKDGKLTIVKPL